MDSASPRVCVVIPPGQIVSCAVVLMKKDAILVQKIRNLKSISLLENRRRSDTNLYKRHLPIIFQTF